MPTQVIPITGFDQVGVIKDSPPVSLPPNALSDALNVRFKDSSVRKMEGEVNIFPNLFDDGTLSYDGTTMKYIVWWPNPNLIDENKGYYLIIREEANFIPPGEMTSVGTRDVAYLIEPGSTTLVYKGHFTRDELANWQHTFFQGGFALIINNGLDAPHYILDSDGNTDINEVPNFAQLPGWESYTVNQITFTDTYTEGNDRNFAIGNAVDFNSERLTVTVNTPTPFTVVFDQATDAANGVSYSVVGGLATVTFATTALPADTQVTITVTSKEPVFVRAGVIRAFGDFLVAGNLVEYFNRNVLDNDGNLLRVEQVDVRNLAGIVRTSDVASPGEVPTNWNPFAAGVSTADEFVLTATGVVQDMGELQGNLYIYSNRSISVMRQTGNPQVPLAVTPITENYGAQTTEAVLEFDGKHFVIGSQDIYLFGGHPGSIQSVSDQRVRRFFFDNLNPLHNQRMFTLRYAQRDEIWICYPTTSSLRGECDQALIWNYRQNNWTIRELTSVVAGDVGPVPGGGLPTSTNSFTGSTGSLEELQAGEREVQSIQFPNTPFNITTVHGGARSTYQIAVQNLPEFTSTASAFELALLDPFSSGPNYGNPNVVFNSPAVNFRVRLINSSDNTADLTFELPRFLEIDRAWVEGGIYFAGFGLVGQPGYYGGQRVIDNDNSGVPTIYRVLNGFGDGSTPSSFYRPNEDSPFYDDAMANNLVYQDTQDIAGVHPRDLVFNAPYGTVPGDGGTGRALTAGQARWEEIGPASTNQQTSSDLVSLFRATLLANTTFNQFFRVLNEDTTDNTFTIEALQDSGDMGFPTYDGIMVEFFFPDIDGDGAADDNGGDFSDSAVNITAAPSSSEGAGAVTFEANTREREYTPFDSANPSTTGRYNTNPTATVLDRVAITFNRTFSGNMIDEEVAADIREGFTSDPTAFWTTTGTGDTINIESVSSGAYDVTISVSVPETISGISNSNFVLSVPPMAPIGERATDGSLNALTPEAPTFLITPPPTDVGERAPLYYTPTLPVTISDRGTLMQNIIQAVMGMGNYFSNWEYVSEAMDVITIQTRDDPSTEIPANLRLADRPSNGLWTVEVVSPGNSQISGLFSPTLTAGSTEITEGRFALNTTPSYLGILVSNPATTSGLEFLVIEAGDPTAITAEAAVNKWLAQIEQAIPRVNSSRRGTGFFLQPANYDSLANFILDVRINDTPGNAQWIYELATTGTNRDTGVTGITVNPASDIPLNLNGSELDHVFDPDAIPVETAATYVRAGGPLKVAQVVSGPNMSTRATLRLNAVTTLIFDIFRPWPRDEINQNLEFPILATVNLLQDATGIFQRLNKIVGADIGWSKPLYSFNRRQTTEDATNFRETINADTDDFPQDYESYIERVQLAIQPEFDTEQLQSLALWADGSTTEFLRSAQQYNQLDVRLTTTNYPGEVTDLAVRPTANVPGAVANTFDISADYKIDMRMHGRFMNYRITDGHTLATRDDLLLSHQAEWRLSGMQADVMKGGKR